MESSLTFRPQSGKLAASSNTEQRCTSCLKFRSPGTGSYSACGACKWVLYCSRECQKANWKEHKVFCKEKRVQNALVEERLARDPILALRKMRLDEELYSVEDFARLHTFTFQQSIASAVHFASVKRKLNFHKKYMLIQLRERDDDDNNPAKKYAFKSAEICDNPVEGASSPILCSAFESFAPHREAEELQVCGQPGYLGLLFIIYITEDGSPWSIYAPIFNWQYNPKVGRNWLSLMKTWSEQGLVFRVVDGDRKPGLMYKDKANWVWKEQSLEALRNDHGISIALGEKKEVEPRPLSVYYSE